MKKKAVLLFLIIAISNAIFGITNMQEIHELAPYRTVENKIIFPKNISQSPKYIFLDSDVTQVRITGKKLDFSKESNAFKSHSYHYIAFWGLFFLMRGTQWSG